MRCRRLLIWTMLAATAAAGGWACRVFKADADKGQILFPHATHIEAGDCSDCHGEVGAATGSTKGQFIPGKKGCANCHDDEIKDKCQMCHKGAKQGVQLARKDRKLSFSHAAHAKRVKGCASCHPAETKGGAAIPGHKTCNTAACHAKTYAKLSCGSCHKDLSRFRRKAVARLSHGPGFVKGHATVARQNIRACTQCHDQTYCADCHAGTSMARASLRFPEQVQRRFIHRGDFLTRHQVEARSDPASCRKCHGQRSCRSCHALNGLAAATAGGAGGGRSRSKHPAGWMTKGSTSFHGHRARQDIARCASCHDRGSASNCIGCHRVGGLGGSPHPAGWSWRNKSDQCRSSSMCATCHPGGRGCK